jgi:hypothetical protein
MSERLCFEVGVQFEVGVPRRVGVGSRTGPHGRAGVRSVGVALPEVGVGKHSTTAPTVGVPTYPVA